MARTNESDSATSQFFINLIDNDFLNTRPGNYGYAVFGKVVDGLDTIDRIAKERTGRRKGHDDVPVTDVVITVRARRVAPNSLMRANCCGAASPAGIALAALLLSVLAVLAAALRRSLDHGVHRRCARRLLVR